MNQDLSVFGQLGLSQQEKARNRLVCKNGPSSIVKPVQTK